MYGQDSTALTNSTFKKCLIVLGLLNNCLGFFLACAIMCNIINTHA